MYNKYGIPPRRLDEIRKRDVRCVYCHKIMTKPRDGGWRGNWATIEHLNFLPPWNNPNTIAICCGSCNSSRGIKKTTDWFKTNYCFKSNINEDSVAIPVQKYIKFVEKFVDELLWTFVKTMPQIPHYYVVKDSLSHENKITFTAFDDYIKRKKYVEIFDSKSYTYLNIGLYKYWIIDNILNKAYIDKNNEITD